MNGRKSRASSHLSSGSGFIQAKRDYLDAWIEIGFESPAALRVWLWLIRSANRRNEVHTSEEAVIVGAKISRRSLFRAYKVLEHKLFIERKGSTIHLNSFVVWRGALDKVMSADLHEAIDKPKRTRKKKESIPEFVVDDVAFKVEDGVMYRRLA